MKKTIETILIISFIFFGIASAVTTFLGVMLVLESYDDYLKLILSGLIAIATSGVMLYIGFSIPKFNKDGRIIFIILAYLVIASLSIFFNFVTFYQGQIMTRTVDQDIRNLNSELTSSYENAKKQLELGLKIYAVRDSIAKYRAAAKSEAENVMRPGKKWRWQKLKEKENLYESQLTNIENIYNLKVKKISTIYNSGKHTLNSIKLEDKLKIKISYAEKVIKTIDELNAISKGINPNFVYSSYKPDFTSVKKPDYILQKIVDVFSNYKNITGKAKTRFAISLFLSVLLDIPIFITLLLLGSDMTVSRKSTNLWN